MIFVGVGTFIHGFDELVASADQAAKRLRIDGFAQIGGGKVEPSHLGWARFLDATDLDARLSQSDIAICHAGMGLIGDALRHGCHLIVMPRRGRTTAGNPANDQLDFARRLAERLPIHLCEEPDRLVSVLEPMLDLPRAARHHEATDIPSSIADFLARTD